MAKLSALLRAPTRLARQALRDWALRRQGKDPDPVTLHRKRIYIIPSGLGIGFALVLFAMLLASMNYNSSMGFALTFLLAGLALVAMHWCHQNLAGLVIRSVRLRPAFAGEDARLELCLENPSRNPRYELLITNDGHAAPPVDLEPGESSTISVPVETRKRGILHLSRINLATGFPFGLFRCWTWLHPDTFGVVYPHPGGPADPPPPHNTDTGGAQDQHRGEEDFAGLRNFRPGDSPRHVAWKAAAKGGDLLVKQFAGTDVSTHWLDWAMLDGLDMEQRLSRLTRWIVDAHAHGQAYGLRVPGTEIPPAISASHRHHCLSTLALYEATSDPVEPTHV
ncbi:MAG: DUF58 domain-containing protein [Gammaproteobacteria bacterium]